ncbi:MAG: hypothetical protein JWP97_3298 [Labilithrix sp.]|nr:hypothetical protein [Labilithrix sp.]
MRLCLSRALSLASAFAVLGVSPLAYAGDPAAAREQVKLGYMLAQEGRCEEAIPHFLESLKLDAKAITLINLASCEEKTSRLSDALGHWVDARSRAQAEGNAAIEAEAEKRAKALEPKLAKLTVTVPSAPPGAEVMRDGVALGPASLGVALPVSPGAHTLVVHAADREDTTTTVTLGEGETKRVTLALGAAKKRAAAPASGSAREATGGVSPLVWAGFGAALVGVGVGTVTGLMAFGKASTADAECPDDVCTPKGMDAVDAGRTLGTISTISFIAGGAFAAVGLYGLTFGKPSAGTSASVGMAFGATSAALRGTF